MCTPKRFDAYPVNHIGNALECFGVVLCCFFVFFGILYKKDIKAMRYTLN